MKKITLSLLLYLLGFVATGAHSASLFFPEMRPVIKKIDPAEWLKNGKEGDGYLTVSSEVIAENSCSNLSDHGFWSSEKTQLVISVTSNGFKSKLDKKEVPIATFDGRENGSECSSLSSSAVQIVPLTLLGSTSAMNPGNLNIVLNVKSSNDSNRDFVGSAKLLLGAAALVVSGGSATAIGWISTTVGSSVLSETQSRANKLLNGMVDAKVPLPLNWADIRSGINSVEIGVYRSNKNMGDLTDKKIQQLQNDPKAEKTKLFTVRFTFSLTRSLFIPAINNIDRLSQREDLSPVRVLNYKMQGSNESFLQILNNTSPSLLISIAHATEKEFTSACALGFEKLSKLDVSSLDTAIIMKTFIDEAKGDNTWYNNPQNVRNCFEQTPVIQEYLEHIYGVPEPLFVVGDVQNGVGQSYINWRNIVGPLLSDFRKALIAKENRKSYLIQFNNDKDIDISFSPEIAPWVTESDNLSEDEFQSITAGNPYPGLTRLANKKIRNIGCFIFKESINLDPTNYGAYFILKTEDNDSYVAFSKFSIDGKTRINKIKISDLNSDWKKHFKSYSYPGGECSSLLN